MQLWGGAEIRIALFLPHLGVTGGLGVHCRSLLASLLKTCPRDEFVVFSIQSPKQLFPHSGLDVTWEQWVDHPRVTYRPIDWPADRSLSLVPDPVLGQPVRESKPDALLCSYYTGLVTPPCPQAVVFHDAGFLDFPEVFGATAQQRKDSIQLAKESIHLMVCVSADARDRICRLLPFDPARAVVVWHALADDDAIYQSANAALWDINRPLWPDGESIADWGEYIFLPVGAATGFNRQRKNIPVGIAGYRLLNRSDIKLIIASTGVVHDQMLRQILPNDELSSGVIRNGIWQSEDGLIRVLPNLDRRPFLQAMSRANIVYYPTKYEGFGLPAIEAMALGVPLVAGNATSLPEIVGPAGILVNPDSAENFAQGLSNVLNNPTLRNDLVCRGKERSKLFTLQRMGEEMKMVFERLVGQAASDTQLRMIE